MNPRLPRVTAKQLIKVLRQRGFLLIRSSGSHHIFRNAEGIRITVPVHSGKVIHPKILTRILKDIGMTRDDLAREI